MFEGTFYLGLCYEQGRGTGTFFSMKKLAGATECYDSIKTKHWGASERYKLIKSSPTNNCLFNIRLK
jgi:hypothetical protein